jgi:excisionase family DNA binding protein
MISSANSARPFLIPREAAKILGVNASKVIGWIHSGELEAMNLATVRAGRPRWRISLGALKKFLAARTSPPATSPRRKPKSLEACAS